MALEGQQRIFDSLRAIQDSLLTPEHRKRRDWIKIFKRHRPNETYKQIRGVQLTGCFLLLQLK